MSTNTVPSTTPTTPCPTWCHHDELGDEDSHVGVLASSPGPQRHEGHSVQICQSTDPTQPGSEVVVWIRGNDARHPGTHPFTVAELLDLSAMFARAAVALEAVSA